MPFLSNIREFRSLTAQGPLVDAYRLLVCFELALKDCGIILSGSSRHDVPALLDAAANIANGAGLLYVAGSLQGYAAQLRTTLGSMTCTGINGRPRAVPPVSYPYIRYTRLTGDWNGADETPLSVVLQLESTCQALFAFLSAQGPAIGVHL